MKKIGLIFLISLFAQLFPAQYMIIGKDSLELKSYIKENENSLKKDGIDKTIKSTQDFILFQQFAQSKKADTMQYFKQAMQQKLLDLRDRYFFPDNIIKPLLNTYIQDNNTEIKTLVFAISKKNGDLRNYQNIYQQIKKGEISMSTAIKSYTEDSGEIIYLKPGVIDQTFYNEIKATSPNAFTAYHETENSIYFAQFLGTRPSLGYLIFASLSYPNDANAAAKKTQIYTDLQNKKSFQEVVGLYATSEQEKKTGGLILGSPTLPEPVYNAVKTLKPGEYTQPILLNNTNFVFYLYNKTPYEITDKTESFFKKEMLETNFKTNAIENLVKQEKASPNYKETQDYQSIKSSYQNFLNFKNPNAVLFQYYNAKVTYSDLKKGIASQFKDLNNISETQWNNLLNLINSQFVFQQYSDNFVENPKIVKEIKDQKNNLYSEYIFSYWLKDEIAKNPKWLTDYYNQNKSLFMAEEAAKGRIAIISDDALTDKIKKDIESPNNWANLKAEYSNKLNKDNKILVDLKDGEMPKYADIFNEYKIPFAKGVYSTKVGDRTLVLAIDEILPKELLPFDDVKDEVTSAVTEQRLKTTLEDLRAKTTITVQTSFMEGLMQNFKK